MKMVEIRLRETGHGEDRSEAVFRHSFGILADDGRDLYTIYLHEDGTLEVNASGFVKHAGRMLTDRLAVRPRVANVIVVSRDEHSASD